MNKQFYHVAPANFRVGDDLLCYNELEAQGYDVAWKWEDAEDGFDGDVVCLFRSLDDARLFVEDFLPTGQILSVDLSGADNVRLVTVSEGYDAALTRIPAEYITPVA